MRVPPGAAGERLDRFLATHLGSRSAAERAVEAGALVDGIARPKSYRLEGGEEISVEAVAAAEPVAPPPEPAIAWEGEHLLVIDKPAGLLRPPRGRPPARPPRPPPPGENAGGGEPQPPR